VAHSEEKAGQVCWQHDKRAGMSSGSGSVNSRSESPCDTRCTLALQHNSPEAASSSYRSRETTRILAEAKSRFIQKWNFHDFGIENKREQDPG
jgi:hypothetical protein